METPMKPRDRALDVDLLDLDNISIDVLVSLAGQAWKNNPRCVGRALWGALEGLDARDSSSPDEIFNSCLDHLRFSTNKGKIKSAITFFKPIKNGQKGIRILNHQLIRYAGYELKSGKVLGDPDQVRFTNYAIALGWRPPSPRTKFDVLPLVIDSPGYPIAFYDIPKSEVLEVNIRHPYHDFFDQLDLKWHALPAIANMELRVGEWRFTAAPFSGHYMVNEIATRNLGDKDRYDVLESVAEGMGLTVSNHKNLWKDRALVELNVAVLHSFDLAGVKIVDHHTVCRQFMKYVKSEEERGNEVSGDWKWLVPPMASSTTEVYFKQFKRLKNDIDFVYRSRDL